MQNIRTADDATRRTLCRLFVQMRVFDLTDEQLYNDNLFEAKLEAKIESYNGPISLQQVSEFADKWEVNFDDLIEVLYPDWWHCETCYRTGYDNPCNECEDTNEESMCVV